MTDQHHPNLPPLNERENHNRTGKPRVPTGHHGHTKEDKQAAIARGFTGIEAEVARQLDLSIASKKNRDNALSAGAKRPEAEPKEPARPRRISDIWNQD